MYVQFNFLSYVYYCMCFLGDMNTAQWICRPPVVVKGTEYTFRRCSLICMAAGLQVPIYTSTILYKINVGRHVNTPVVCADELRGY